MSLKPLGEGGGCPPLHPHLIDLGQTTKQNGVMTKQLPRMSLRERVAARKAGAREQESESRRILRKRLGFLGMVLQVTGLVLVGYEVFKLMTADIMAVNLTSIIVYSAVFLVGRLLKSGTEAMGWFGRR